MKKALNAIILSIKSTIILSGIIHLAVLAIYSIKTGSIEYLNAFEILSLDRLFPQLGMGPEKVLISWFLVGVTIALFYQIQKGKKN